MVADIPQYFSDLPSPQLQQLEALYPLYREWNSKINVISRKDIGNLYERHILHSLAIAKFIQFVPGTKVLDIGTGGGFPGIPLAILFPETGFLLADSVAKKLKVVEAIIAATGLKNVRTMHTRAENIREKFDFAVSRAVTQLPEIISWTKGKISQENKNSIPNGLIYLRGEDNSGELQGFKEELIIKKLSDYFPGEFFSTKILVYARLNA